ncbi:Clan SC, family S33, methylesterase-like serine peptidase [Histomonas meleagridis]|uniref:Clan SC, family S33, methylesterase-like serine peptidase n=1 Tax=Histomonas meleagridis TaxID=135588 RepID=UPI0035595368|nr:Clan SC, family S33, methylesterase-like serine peptidase [Histomonas meleagridis]KAH0803044.1 Clan SC, family S33, methylesterase-like serine peptidase [Histomonas meleagridis]
MHTKQEDFTPWQTYWDSKEMIDTPRGKFNVYSTNVESDFVLLCVHGAGHSGLSFSLIAPLLHDTCKIVSPDLKCHGETPGDSSKDLSLDNLVEDIIEIGKPYKEQGKKLLLLGHSLGGSIATKASYTLKPIGLFVIDTIEGTALTAMPGMQRILNSRPKSFKTVNDAIRYFSMSGEMANPKSAAVSGAGRVRKCEDGKYRWITDLMPSEPYWVGWFKGFAESFIKAPTYKVLILPNINNMDKAFIIGHMSGKFQLEIVNGTHHCLHEDNPEHVKDIICKFIERMNIPVPVWKIDTKE